MTRDIPASHIYQGDPTLVIFPNPHGYKPLELYRVELRGERAGAAGELPPVNVVLRCEIPGQGATAPDREVYNGPASTYQRANNEVDMLVDLSGSALGYLVLTPYTDIDWTQISARLTLPAGSTRLNWGQVTVGP
jgi:hypothetical protein